MRAEQGFFNFFPGEKSQLHKILPFPLPLVPFSFSPLLFPFTAFFSLSFLLALSFPFPFPIPFLSPKSSQEVWGALLAPPAGRAVIDRYLLPAGRTAANRSCTDVKLQLHKLEL